VDYIDFEGRIAEGSYGAGQVAIWDHGTYELLEDGDPMDQVAAGKLAFRLHGQKLKGDFRRQEANRQEDGGQEGRDQNVRDQEAHSHQAIGQEYDERQRRARRSAAPIVAVQ
jgi:DNA polymerase Ligase (LigD)